MKIHLAGGEEKGKVKFKAASPPSSHFPGPVAKEESERAVSE